ncbi:MFS transporter [Streptomyces sp. 900116325]
MPVALLVLVLAPRVLPRVDRSHSTARGFEGAGTVTITAGVLLLVYALTETTWSAGAVAVLLLVAFVLIERRQQRPLVPLRVFRSRNLVTADLAALAWACATIGWQLAAVLYLQQVQDYGALTTGLGIVPMGLAIVVTANLAGRLISRCGLGRTAAVGMLIQAAGILLFLRTGATADYIGVLLPALLVHGVGNGLSFPGLNIAAVGGLPDEQQGLASGLITSSIQIGAGIGVTLLASLMATCGSGLDGYRLVFLVAGCFSLLGPTLASIGLRARVIHEAQTRT